MPCAPSSQDAECAMRFRERGLVVGARLALRVDAVAPGVHGRDREQDSGARDAASWRAPNSLGLPTWMGGSP